MWSICIHISTYAYTHSVGLDDRKVKGKRDKEGADGRGGVKVSAAEKWAKCVQITLSPYIKNDKIL